MFQQATQMPYINQLQNRDKSILDSSNYGVPTSDKIMVRLSENFYQFGSNYSQLTVIIMLLGGITNLTFLIILGISCAMYFYYLSYFLRWILLMRNDQIIEAIPAFGMTTDKKKVILFLVNVFIMYILCGDSIFTYIGVGFMISFFHAFLFKSRNSTPQDSLDAATQYRNFEMPIK